jgi:hypothetical protein
MCKLLAAYVRYKLGQGLVYNSKDGKWVASPLVPNDVVVEMRAAPQSSLATSLHWNCIECAKTFGSESALHQHNRAKHGSGPSVGGTGEQSTDSDLLRRGDPRFRTMHLWFMLKFCFFPLFLVYACCRGGEFFLTLHIEAYICTHTYTFMMCTR